MTINIYLILICSSSNTVRRECIIKIYPFISGKWKLYYIQFILPFISIVMTAMQLNKYNDPSTYTVHFFYLKTSKKILY